MKKRKFECVGALESEEISGQAAYASSLIRSYVPHESVVITKRKCVETIGTTKNCFAETSASEKQMFERVRPQKRGRPEKILNALEPPNRRKKSEMSPSLASVKRKSRSPTQISAMDMLMDTNKREHFTTKLAASKKVLDITAPVILTSNSHCVNLTSLEKPNAEGMNISRHGLVFALSNACAWLQDDGLIAFGLCQGFESFSIFKIQ